MEPGLQNGPRPQLFESSNWLSKAKQKKLWESDQPHPSIWQISGGGELDGHRGNSFPIRNAIEALHSETLWGPASNVWQLLSGGQVIQGWIPVQGRKLREEKRSLKATSNQLPSDCNLEGGF